MNDDNVALSNLTMGKFKYVDAQLNEVYHTKHSICTVFDSNDSEWDRHLGIKLNAVMLDQLHKTFLNPFFFDSAKK